MAAHIPGTICVIDDEPSVVRALTGLLRRDGYRVGTASHGQHALTQLQERPYDVSLCDLHMPDLDGPAFYAILARQYPSLRLRVIFLTGDTRGSTHRTFLTQCGRPWLRKPCPIATIQRAIQAVLQDSPHVEDECGCMRVACLACPHSVLTYQRLPSPTAPSGAEGLVCPHRHPNRRVLRMVYFPTMTITSTTDLACPSLHCAIRHGAVQDVPADPEAAAFLGARVSPGCA
jgi:CheY-like chemotaxis protein